MKKEPKMIVVHQSTYIGKDTKKWRVTARAPLLSPEENVRRQAVAFKRIHEILLQQRNFAPVN